MNSLPDPLIIIWHCLFHSQTVNCSAKSQRWLQILVFNIFHYKHACTVYSFWFCMKYVLLYWCYLTISRWINYYYVTWHAIIYQCSQTSIYSVWKWFKGKHKMIFCFFWLNFKFWLPQPSPIAIVQQVWYLLFCNNSTSTKTM